MSPHEHHGVAHPVPGAITNDSLQTGDRSTPSPVGAGAWAGLWNALTGLIATVAGIAPHVLHHVGLFAGAFLITGAAGNLLFGALGLLLSVPLLRRLHRRFGTWKAPAIAVGVFAMMFAVSAVPHRPGHQP
jgi:hypothetical protein